MPEVIVIGAGLAGLACALELTGAGVEVQVHEASDAVGGRVRTDLVDGIQLDRGFQVHNTGYLEAQRVLDHEALSLQRFVAGALVRYGDRLYRVGDPRRVPQWATSTAFAPIGSLKDKAALVALAVTDGALPVARLLARPETSTYAALRARGLSDVMIDRFLRPFLAGVFLEDELKTSSRAFDLVWRSFVRGRQCVPAAGMQAIPTQLAARLPAGALQLEHRVTTLPTARAVVVATDPATAALLLPGLEIPAMQGVTTHYHLAPEPPVRDGAIVLDGERSGPVVNTVVLTNVAPSYAPGRVLISSSVVSGDASEPAVRTHLASLYGVETRRWEHVAAYDIRHALPSQAAPLGNLDQPVRLRPGLFLAGDHRDSASIDGALTSGRRAAAAVLQEFRS